MEFSWNQPISYSLKPKLDPRLKVLLHPFRTKPVAKCVAFDKLSPHRPGKGPEHTHGSQSTEWGKILFCEIIQHRCSIHPQPCQYRWDVSRNISPFVALNLPATPVHQLQVVFELKRDAVLFLILKRSKTAIIRVFNTFLYRRVIRSFRCLGFFNLVRYSILSDVCRARTSKSASWCRITRSFLMATAAIRQSISFLTVSPFARHWR